MKLYNTCINNENKRNGFVKLVFETGLSYVLLLNPKAVKSKQK